jgi:hypothetical protein
MKKVLSLLAIAGVVCSPPALAQGDSADVYRQTGAWALDYGDDYCRLAGSFTNGKDEVGLAFQRLQPGGFTQLILIGNGVRTFRRATELGYRLAPTGGVQKARYARSETPDKKQYLGLDGVTFMSLAPAPGAPPGPPVYDRQAEQAAARAITAIELSEGLTSPVRIETGSLGAPVTALQACADDLLTVWGLDAAKHKALTAPAVLNPAPNGVLPQGTIPFSEFSKFTGGANQVRLIIGADGKPASCTIYSPTLSQTLNDRICSLALERASFEPAKDADGQAMASYWMGSPMFLGPPRPGMRR